MPTYFDGKAATWDEDPAKVDRARVVGEAIRAAAPVTRSTRLLEYGAGTGLVSQALAPHVGAITLAEPSEGMRSVALDKVDAGQLPPGTRVWDLDLARDEAPAEQFDLIVTVMTLHHIADLAPVLAGFAGLLGGGGHLCVVDLDKEDGSFHASVPDFHGHDGFSRAGLTAQLEAAGFTGVHFQDCYEVSKDGGTYPLFLATCAVEA